MDIDAFNRRNKQDFAKQQRWLKQVLAGKSLYCEQCGQKITSQHGADAISLKCPKGCTDVILSLG